MSASPPGWLGSLAAGQRARVLAAMRTIRARSDRANRVLHRMMPRWGELQGPATVDALLDCETLAWFLGRLARGETPEAAAEAAREHAREIIRMHNDRWRRDVNAQRSEGQAELMIDWALATVRGAADLFAPLGEIVLPPTSPAADAPLLIRIAAE